MQDNTNEHNTPLLDLQTIQAQIQNHGAFSPLHWLLQLGYLPFGDYEAWRQGKLTSLDGLFSLSEESLQALLEATTILTKALQLVAEPQLFFSWDAGHRDAGQIRRQLKLSNHSGLAQWLGQRWLRPEDLPQMDLFMDSGAAVAENELADLLCQRRWSDAELAYHQLSESAPGNSHLAQYETLILYGKHMAAAEDISEDEAGEEMAALMEEIAPVAADLLQHQASDYLSAAWQRIAKNLPVTQFYPDQPQLHASFALAQLPDWPAVISAIKEVPDFDQFPALIMRLAEACWHQQPDLAMLLWCKVIELEDGEGFPERANEGFAEELLDAIKYGRFIEPWNSFWELDLTVGYFPAYLLLQEPGLLHQLPNLPTSEPDHVSFAAVKQLLLARGNEQQQTQYRQSLQNICPKLLRVYLQRHVLS